MGIKVNDTDISYVVKTNTSASSASAIPVVKHDIDGSTLYVFSYYHRFYFSKDDYALIKSIKVFRTDSPYGGASVSTSTSLPIEAHYGTVSYDGGTTWVSEFDGYDVKEPFYYGDKITIEIQLHPYYCIQYDSSQVSGYMRYDSFDRATNTFTFNRTVQEPYHMFFDKTTFDGYCDNTWYNYFQIKITKRAISVYNYGLYKRGYNSQQYTATGVFSIAINGVEIPSSSSAICKYGDTITVTINLPEGMTLPSDTYLFNETSNSAYLLKNGTTTITFYGISTESSGYPYTGSSYSGGGYDGATVRIYADVIRYTYVLSAPSYLPVTAKRTSSPLGGAPSQTLSNGATFYHGDVVQFNYTDNTANTAYKYFGYAFLIGTTQLTTLSTVATSYTITGNVQLTMYGAVKTFKVVWSNQKAGVTFFMRRTSSPYGGGSTTGEYESLALNATLYYGDVLQVGYYLDVTDGLTINTHTVNGTSIPNRSSSYTTITVKSDLTLDLTVTPDAYSLDWDTFSADYAYLTIKRTSSPYQGAALETLTTSSTVYYGDVLNMVLTINSGCKCFGWTINWGAIKTSSYNFTVVPNSYDTVRIRVDACQVKNWGLTFSGTSVTAFDNSQSSVSIPNKYYTCTQYDGSSIQVVWTNSTVYTSYVTAETLVDTIAANAFKGKSSLTSVTIPSTVKWIGDYAFAQCPNLATVTMSATPTSIGQYAFWLTKITSLSSYMYNCTSLGSGCFASYDGWYLAAPSGTTSLGGDSVINRLRATSANTDYGRVYEVRSRFNVHKGSGDNGTSGGSYKCTCSVTVKGKNTTRSWTTLNTTAAFSEHKYGVTFAVCGPSVSLSESFSTSSGGSNYSSTSSGCANKTLNAGGTCDHDCYTQVHTTCLTEHTLLTLANGSRKRADQITYKDLLLCYNFETGKQDYQYPLSITKGETHDHFTRIHLENSLYIDICGHHDIYDPKAHMFRAYGDGNIMSVVLGDYYILDDSNQIVKIKSIERIEKEVTSYCIITSGTITAYADTAMIGMSHMNYGRIDSTNKFSKEFETDKLICYDYNTFKEEVYDEDEQDLIIGTCLHFVHYYNKDGSGLGRLLNPLKRRIPLPQYKNKKLYTLGFIDKELTEMQSVEDEIIVLPEIKSKGKTKWYIVGEYKYLNPGDTYITKFSTVIRAV